MKVAKLFITMPLAEPAAWATASYTYQNLQIGSHPRAQPALLQSTHPVTRLLIISLTNCFSERISGQAPGTEGLT